MAEYANLLVYFGDEFGDKLVSHPPVVCRTSPRPPAAASFHHGTQSSLFDFSMPSYGMYSVFQKALTFLFRCSFYKYQPIFVIFGTQ